MPDLLSRCRGCLLGLATGDAVGTAVEFKPRGTFPLATGMTGGGPFNLPAGAWTDDTSMALCLGTSLLECGGFDAADQMRRYCRWYREGYLSSTGKHFDIGGTTSGALERFLSTGEPYSGSPSPHSAGNGSIMRLAPVPIYWYPDVESAVKWAGESSRTTHGAAECVESCRLLAGMLCRALAGEEKEGVLFGSDPAEFSCPKVKALAAGEYRGRSRDRISGSGYVIDCLEASAWCLLQTGDFREAVLLAVNLGNDADTTGAVCGQLAGALYGEEGIPPEWLSRLVMCGEIREMAGRLAAGPKRGAG